MSGRTLWRKQNKIVGPLGWAEADKNGGKSKGIYWAKCRSVDQDWAKQKGNRVNKKASDQNEGKSFRATMVELGLIVDDSWAKRHWRAQNEGKCRETPGDAV